MPSTYTVNLGIEKPATGEQSGTWGDTTNVNFDILDQAINGAERVTLTSAGSSGSPNALQITNGATSDGRNKWLEFYSASDLGGSAFVQLDPNDAEKIVFVRNSLAGSQSLILFQGTYNSARDLEVPAGVDMVVKFDGGGASAATVTDVYNKLRVTELTTPTLTATTADINGGTLDNSVIGGTTAAAITGTTITANTSLNIAGDGATVTGIKDEDDMSSNSPTKLATQQSIKAYVDSQVGTVDTLAEILANGNTSGANNLIINNGQALTSNTINETTAGSGVTIDSVLLKDDVVNATDVETGSISANDGTAAATIANTTGNFTITNFISNSVDIGGGAIDGTNIGASSRGSGAFTTLSSNSTTTIAGAAKFTANVDTTSSTALELKVGKISAVPSDVTDAFVAIHDTGGPGSLAGDLVLVPRSSNGVDNAVRIYSGYTTPVERLAVGYSELAINDPSNDYNFRVESDSNTHALFVDAGNSRIGVGTSSPLGDVQIVTATAGTVFNVNHNTGGSYPKASGIGLGATSTALSVSSDGGTVSFTGGAGIYAENTAASGNPTNLVFWTNLSGSPAQALSIGGDKVATFSSTVTHTGLTLNHNTGMYTTDKTLSSYSATNGVYLNGNTNGWLQLSGDGNRNTRINIFGDGNASANAITLVTNNTEMLRIAATESIFNDASADRDFRVESDSYANMLTVDAGTNRVGIRTSPAYLLHVDAAGVEEDIPLRVDGYKTGVQQIWLNNERAPYLTNGRGTQLIFGNNGTIGGYIGAIGYGSGGNGELAMGIMRTGGAGTLQTVLSANSNTDHTILRAVGAAGSSIFLQSPDGAAELLKLNTTESVFNEGAGDSDFRVESVSNTNMLYVDAGSNEVGVGTSVPRRTFDVNGVSALGSGSNAVTIGADNGSALTHIANNTTPSTTVGAGGTLDITTCAGNNGFGEMMIGNSSSGGFAKVVFGYNMQPHIVVQNGTEFESIAYGGAVTSTKIALSWNNTNSILRVQCGASKTATINGFMQSISTPT